MSKLIQHKDCVTFVVAICICLCIQGCGGNDTSSQSAGKVGSASFSIQWPNNASMKQTGIQRDTSSITSIDCTSLGVATVSAKITDSSGTTTLATGSWSCSSHTGTVDNIPAGSGYQVIVTASDANGATLYQGTTTGITIIAGQNTNIGTVTLTQMTTTVPFIWGGTYDLPYESGDSPYVGVYTDSTETTPIGTATVTINGTPLIFSRAWYSAQSFVIAAGDTVDLSVTYEGITYTAQGNQFTTFPSVTTPTSGATWMAANANIITITSGSGVPAGEGYFADIYNSTSYIYDHNGTFDNSGTASVIVPANTLPAGSYTLRVLVNGASLNIANAADGSSFLIDWYTEIPITTQ